MSSNKTVGKHLITNEYLVPIWTHHKWLPTSSGQPYPGTVLEYPLNWISDDFIIAISILYTMMAEFCVGILVTITTQAMLLTYMYMYKAIDQSSLTH